MLYYIAVQSGIDFHKCTEIYELVLILRDPFNNPGTTFFNSVAVGKGNAITIPIDHEIYEQIKLFLSEQKKKG